MPAKGFPSLFKWFRDTPNEATAKTLLIALAVALVCALGVSTATVILRPIYHANMEQEQSDLILGLMAGIFSGDLVAQSRLITLEAGDGEGDLVIPPDQDIAGIGVRPHSVVIHEIRSEQNLQAVVLPVYGRGFASTLRGYLAVAADGRTIEGLRFYDHGETPGIGGRIDDPDWLARWRKLTAYDDKGRVQVSIARGQAQQDYQVDAITGATYTSRGVHNLVRFWLGPLGFGPYLQALAEEAK